MIAKCGIYQIICAAGGTYIGSSRNMPRRWKQHLDALRKNKHISKSLQAAWTLHGEKMFSFVILEECNESIVFIRENFYIKSLQPEFNSVRNVKRSVTSRRIRMPPPYNRLEKLMRRMIKNAGTSHTIVAHKSGLSPSHLSQVLRGRKRAVPKILNKLSVAIGATNQQRVAIHTAAARDVGYDI